MGRKPTKRPVSPWLTGRSYQWNANKKMPPWIKLDQSLMKDAIFRSLPQAVQTLYMCMAIEAGDKADDWFVFHYGIAKQYFIPRPTLTRGVAVLKEAGFIETRRPKTGWKSDTFAPTEYRLVTNWKNK